MYRDSGAINHITNDSAKLLDLKVYTGVEKLRIGNGTALSIADIGSVLFNTETLLLDHVLQLTCPSYYQKLNVKNC